MASPRRVEKYEIIGEVGHGGMATVYRARDVTLERLVALKVMHPHLQGAREARARFAREARTIARLHHPNILEIYDYSGEDSPTSYIATELLTGPTLRRFADEHPDMPAEIAACFLIEVARALEAAHAEGVVHRDVKPENVLLHEDRTVKLTDFGIAQLVDAHSMTTTGQILGSPGHMAPEQVEGKDCTERSDIFSLGTVLYFLATGQMPFSGRNPHHVLKQIVDCRYTDPQQVRPAIGGTLAAIIRRCLARDPAERYASCAALLEALTRFVAQVGIDEPQQTLAAYLQDPAAEGEAMRRRVIEHLIEAGERCTHRDRRAAYDHFSRVLALDEGNPRVLAALERMGRRVRVRRRLVVGSALAALGSVAVVWAWPDAEPSVATATATAEEAAPPSSPASSGTPLDPPDSDSEPEVSEPEVHEPEAPEPASSDPPPRRQRQAAPARDPSPAPRARSDEPREVRFRPEPANVSISIDGGEPRRFGPSFRSAMLEPGEHRLRFIGAHDCCVDEEFTVRVPPGPGVTVISRRLAYRPAGLYVVSNVPADVVVDGGAVQGRSRSVMRVPIDRSLRERHRVEVSAAGHEPVQRAVELQAGQVKTLEVTLQAAASR